MLRRRNALLLGSPLIRHSARTVTLSQWNRRSFSTPSQEIAVLGGGISGLASAYYIAQDLPNAKITIYERGPRLGGWLQSSRVEVPGGSVLFEHGPRSIRPQMFPPLMPHLIQELGLIDDVVFTPQTAPSARKRFVYYPDHLVSMPTDLGGILTSLFEPLFRKVPLGILREPFVDSRDETVTDESIGHFLTRRTNQHVTNLVSAILHGIYAGDIYQLSMKSIGSLGWFLEKRHGSLLEGFKEMYTEKGGLIPQSLGSLVEEYQDRPLNEEFVKKLSRCSVLSFRRGIQQLTQGLERSLTANENVTIHLNTPVNNLEMDGSTNKVKVITNSDHTSSSSDYVVSTMFARHLASICKRNDSPGKSLLPSLSRIHAVTVMVVNLFFEKQNLLPIQGFGYLIPRHIPFKQNPERALGVIFDSDAVSGQDTADGTKITVMLGGHWWDGWSNFPSDEEGITMAQSVLARHLGITDMPSAGLVHLQKECIPQHTVGHSDRLKSAHQDLLKEFRGRLRVAGSSYAHVGLNDCLIGARDIAKGLADTSRPLRTGLEKSIEEIRYARMVPVRKRDP